MARAPRQQCGTSAPPKRPLAGTRPSAHIPPMDTATRLAPPLAARLAIGLNGEERAFDGPLSVGLLLQRLGLDARKVAVERNKAIVRRAQYGETWLESGDAIEIVHFIGGG